VKGRPPFHPFAFLYLDAMNFTRSQQAGALLVIVVLLALLIYKLS
jgi:hypothetical protein